jgi:hypothetical protein
MRCSRSADRVLRIDDLPDDVLLGRLSRGNRWYMCVDGGDTLFSDHPVA